MLNQLEEKREISKIRTMGASGGIIEGKIEGKRTRGRQWQVDSIKGWTGTSLTESTVKVRSRSDWRFIAANFQWGDGTRWWWQPNINSKWGGGGGGGLAGWVSGADLIGRPCHHGDCSNFHPVGWVLRKCRNMFPHLLWKASWTDLVGTDIILKHRPLAPCLKSDTSWEYYNMTFAI